MNQLANALGKDFLKQKDAVRTRTFELGGHVFKVKVPLTAEFEAMQKRMNDLDQTKLDEYYANMTEAFEKYRDKKDLELDIKFENDDVLLDGKSLREAAKNKLIAENRITELFKLLVPAEDGFDMGTITYPMIEELFPFPVQLQIIDKISHVVSPSYESAKGK